MRFVPLMLCGLLLVCDAVADETTTPRTTESTLSVMTFNIRYANPRDGVNQWKFRSDRVAEILKTTDLFGLQEVLPSQLQDLKTALPGYRFYAVGRDDGKAKGEACAIGYNPEQLEQLDTGTFWLSPEPERVGSKGWDASLPRIASYLRLRDKASNRTFWLINTHFDHRGVTAREQSAIVIARQTQQLTGGEPVVLLGDFNALPDAEPLRLLTGRSERTRLDPEKHAAFQFAEELSTTPATGPNSTWTGFREIAPNRKIDHVLISGPIMVRSYSVLDTQREGRYASDHLPVKVELQFPKPPRSQQEVSP